MTFLAEEMEQQIKTYNNDLIELMDEIEKSEKERYESEKAYYGHDFDHATDWY
jgi:hypothetical protein